MDSIAGAMDSMAARKESLKQAFRELERETAVLSRITIEWKDLDEAFAEAERDVKRRYEELAAKERAFEAKVKSMEEALERRGKAIVEREESLLAVLNDQKAKAISQGLVFSAVKLEAGKAVAPDGDAVEKQQKQQHEQEQESQEEQVHDQQVKQQQQQEELALSSSSISQSMDLDLNVPQPEGGGGGGGSGGTEDNEDEFAVATEALTSKPPSLALATAEQVSVRPELRAVCESMDGNGLRKFIVDHRKEAAALRNELPAALQCASDPCRLVLEALEAYHPDITAPQFARKEPELSANRRACILVLECLQVALADPVLGVDNPVVPSGVKDVAKELAEQWRSRMDVRKEGSPLDAQAFLQLVATFGIASHYDEDELCKLVSTVARRKQTPTLCRALGLAGKIPEIVEKLIEEGKQIEALTFANEFGIMDRVQPVSLLKNYLKDARKVAQTMLKSGHSSAAAQNDSMMKELSALRSVLKCIDEYNLESEYPSSPLQKRIQNLEKAKMDRKRTGGSVKGQSKRPRGSNNGGFGYRNNSNSDRNSDRNHYGAAGGVSAYQFVSPVAFEFERQNQPGYLGSYGPANPTSRTPITSIPPNSYLYSAGADGPIYGAAAGYASPATAYGGYAALRSALPPPPPAYQTSFMH